MSVQPAASGAALDPRREGMLLAALDVIAERGLGHTRIADVASRAGTSPALVIYYFRTKDELLTAAIRYSEDSWYEQCRQRLSAIPTASGRLEELVAISCLPEADSDQPSWLMWLELWAEAVRHRAVAAVREASDERWRRTIATVVREGQATGEFQRVDVEEFTLALAALLDGFAVQVVLEDSVVTPERAFRAGMNFAAQQLGFRWTARRNRRAPSRTQLSRRIRAG